MQLIRNIVIEGKHGKPIVLDIYFVKNGTKKPVVIFSHGFKGFKDWGHFDLLAQEFAKKGFIYVKFNFSHNGTTPEHPDEFVDLEAFGNNNFTKELDDLGTVIDYVLQPPGILPPDEMDARQLYLTGHSRGGGISILKAHEDRRVRKLATWASVNEFGKFWSKEEMEAWKKSGVKYIYNARTGQQMPLYYQMYEDYYRNYQRLHIPSAVKALRIPFLIIHGTADETVPYTQAVEMHRWNPGSRLLLIEGANHTFGGKHPWESDTLPEDSVQVLEATTRFFRKPEDMESGIFDR